ncbi:MAG: MFS transporter [Actinomycetales bacterium]|nr:MFS transporter [Actinomycetales bacterium]
MSASTTTVGPPPGSPTPVVFTHRQIQVILTGLMSGMFLAALDQMVVTTAIRTIADDLDGLSIQAWATTAYLITATISTPLYGKLSDLYGRRPFFLTAISLFVLGSVACTVAQSMYQLAACRAFQGLGAGGLFSLALAIIGDIIPPRERARYQGYFLAVWGTSSVLGPMLGGILAGQDSILGITGWRWVFLINVPVGMIALALVARVLHLPHTRREHRIDVPGALALVIALVPLLLVAERGRDWGWTSNRSLTCFAIGAVGIVVFLVAESWYGDDALLPLRLFNGRTFAVGSILNLIFGVGMFGGMVCLPLYLQIVKGKSPTEAGFLMIPMTIGIMTSSVVSGQLISRTGRYKIFPVLGSLLIVVGLGLLQGISADTSLVTICLFTVVMGLGLGLCMQPLVLAIQNAVPARDMGVATSSATFFRQMGGTIGTAVFLSVLFSTVVDRIREAFDSALHTPAFQRAIVDPAVQADPANAPVLDALRSGGTHLGSGTLNDSSFIGQLDPRLARPFLVGFAEAMDQVFVIAAVVMVVAFLVVLALPEEPLRLRSGIQAQADEEAERLATASAAG